ncbi:hypothetical protein N9Y42_06100 [Mariniblastus sp.]|nr:hypothetical protein [Mariniblastus sp.]
MSNVTTKAVVSFQPAASWDWDGWNGELDLSTKDLKVVSGGEIVGVESDLVALNTKLAGKRYKGVGFDDIPGVVVNATILVTQSTLSNVAEIAGKKVAHSGTSGKFIVMVSPSFMKSKPPIPDPVICKNGTWEIKDPGQDALTSS